MTELNKIDGLSKRYADARSALVDSVTEMNAALEAVRRQHLPLVKRAVARSAERHAELKAEIEAAPLLFKKPKTLVLHGIKVGYAKGKGGIVIADPGQSVKLIRKHLPEKADVLIKSTEKPIKGALAELSVQDLKRIGCTVIETGDQVVIHATDSEVDKLVKALLKEGTEDDDSEDD